MTTAFSVPNYLHAHAQLADRLDLPAFEAAAKLIDDRFASGAKVITCGNGGSAHTASHYITDWTKMGNLASGRKFRGVSLCDNVGLITAFGNDLSYDEIFAGQLRTMLDPQDLVIAVSGSGNSPNVVKAVEYANSVDAHTLAVVGYDGGRLKQIARTSVWVPSFDMQLCEDVHLMFGHMVMKTLCRSPIVA